MNIRKITLLLITVFCIAGIRAADVTIQRSTLVGNGIVEFIPTGFDKNKTPS